MNLDAHSLGLTALKCLVELLPTRGGPQQVAEAMQGLRAAWRRYWFDAQQLWQPIFDAFRGSGDFDAIRARFTRAKVHAVVSDDLCALRSALRDVQQACAGLPMDTGLAGMPALCEALLLMVQAGRADVPAIPPSEAAAAEADCVSATWSDPSESTASPDSSPSSLTSSGCATLGDSEEEK